MTTMGFHKVVIISVLLFFTNYCMSQSSIHDRKILINKWEALLKEKLDLEFNNLPARCTGMDWIKERCEKQIESIDFNKDFYLLDSLKNTFNLKGDYKLAIIHSYTQAYEYVHYIDFLVINLRKNTTLGMECDENYENCKKVKEKKKYIKNYTAMESDCTENVFYIITIFDNQNNIINCKPVIFPSYTEFKY